MYKVHVVEDTDDVFLLLKIYLTKMNFEVTRSIMGIDAIDFCKNNKGIDLVLMDIRLPDISGLEAVKKIREFDNDLLIIANSAYVQPSDVQEAYDSGCNDYMMKPILYDKMRSTLLKYLPKINE